MRWYEKYRIITPKNNYVALTGDLLQRYKIELKNILRDIVDICENNNLCYMLGGGSALGAVRHQDMIPWDDDIDINMPRADIDRLIDILKNEWSEKYHVISPEETPEYGFVFVKIAKNGTVLKEIDSIDSLNLGVSIDIFPIENTYDSLFLRIVHGVRCIERKYLLSSRIMWEKRFSTYQRFGWRIPIVVLFRSFIGLLISMVPIAKLTQWCNKMYRSCKKEGKFVVIPSGRKHFYGEIYNRERFLSTIEVSFGDLKCAISVDYDAYLKNLYGDYMTEPSVDDREKHFFVELKF